MNKNEREGQADEIKGKVKQAVADATDDPGLDAEGKLDEASGKVQGAFGTAQRKVGETLENMGEKVKK